MPVFRIGEELLFPNPELADEEGLLGVGGDLSPKRLLLAYQHGIFPWYNDDQPILWWAPDPRCVLYPERLKVSKSMHQVLRKKPFYITFDEDFEAVMRACKTIPRKEQEGTWIDEDMVQAYKELHELGLAHSVEVWQEKKLVGGLYGVSLGQCFFGESMFSKVSNASKYGFIHLVRWLQQRQFRIIDCQIHNHHLESLGAEMISRTHFLQELDQFARQDTRQGKWTFSFPTS